MDCYMFVNNPTLVDEWSMLNMYLSKVLLLLTVFNNIQIIILFHIIFMITSISGLLIKQ